VNRGGNPQRDRPGLFQQSLVRQLLGGFAEQPTGFDIVPGAVDVRTGAPSPLEAILQMVAARLDDAGPLKRFGF